MVKFYNQMRAEELAAADGTATAGRQKAMDELQAEWDKPIIKKLQQLTML